MDYLGHVKDTKELSDFPQTFFEKIFCVEIWFCPALNLFTDNYFSWPQMLFIETSHTHYICLSSCYIISAIFLRTRGWHGITRRKCQGQSHSGGANGYCEDYSEYGAPNVVLDNAAKQDCPRLSKIVILVQTCCGISVNPILGSTNFILLIRCHKNPMLSCPAVCWIRIGLLWFMELLDNIVSLKLCCWTDIWMLSLYIYETHSFKVSIFLN